VGEYGEYGESGDYDELAELRREVARTRPIIAKMAEQARLSGQVVDPPDSLRRALGLEIPEAPEWVHDTSGNDEWRAELAHGVVAAVTLYGEPGRTAYYYDWSLVVLYEDDRHRCLVDGQSPGLDGAKRAVLKAAERLGVALVARARVGLKALETPEVDHD
jgi:hypothetical protein